MKMRYAVFTFSFPLSIFALVALARLPGVRTNQWHKAHPAEALGAGQIAAPREPQQQLLVAPANWNNQPATIGQLPAQRLRRPLSRRRDHNRVEPAVGRQPGGPIAHVDM